MNDFDYGHWQKVATRYSRRKSEAADLLHDALLDAIRAGRTDFSKDATHRWFAGVLRNRAAMVARTAARRSRREKSRVIGSNRATQAPPRSFIESLTPSARSVATLVAAGLNRDEIIAALNIAPTAFRQRLTTIRRAWQSLPAGQRDRDDVTDDGPADLGLIRRALLAQVRRVGGIGTHDPDGHLLVFENIGSQTKPRRQQLQKRKD